MEGHFKLVPINQCGQSLNKNRHIKYANTLRLKIVTTFHKQSCKVVFMLGINQHLQPVIFSDPDDPLTSFISLT